MRRATARLCQQERRQADAVDRPPRRLPNAAEIAKRWQQVDMRRDRLDRASGPYAVGIEDGTRRPDAAFVRRPLDPPQTDVKTARLRAVVAKEHHNGVARQGQFLQFLQQPADVVVHALDHGIDAGRLRIEAAGGTPVVIAVGRLDRVVRRVVGQIAERTASAGSADELDGRVGQHVGDVSLGPHVPAVAFKIGVEIMLIPPPQKPKK